MGGSLGGKGAVWAVPTVVSSGAFKSLYDTRPLSLHSAASSCVHLGDVLLVVYAALDTPTDRVPAGESWAHPLQEGSGAVPVTSHLTLQSASASPECNLLGGVPGMGARLLLLGAATLRPDPEQGRG